MFLAIALFLLLAMSFSALLEVNKLKKDAEALRNTLDNTTLALTKRISDEKKSVSEALRLAGNDLKDTSGLVNKTFEKITSLEDCTDYLRDSNEKNINDIFRLREELMAIQNDSKALRNVVTVQKDHLSTVSDIVLSNQVEKMNEELKTKKKTVKKAAKKARK